MPGSFEVRNGCELRERCIENEDCVGKHGKGSGFVLRKGSTEEIRFGRAF